MIKMWEKLNDFWDTLNSFRFDHILPQSEMPQNDSNHGFCFKQIKKFNQNDFFY